MDLSNISLLIYALLVLQLQIAFVAPKIAPRKDLQLDHTNINRNVVEYRDKVIHSLRASSSRSDLYDGKKGPKIPPKARPKLYKTRSKRSLDGGYQPHLAELPKQDTRNEKVKVEGRWSHHTELHTELRSLSPRMVTKAPQISPKTSQLDVLSENKISVRINNNNTQRDGKTDQGTILYLNIPSNASDNLLQRLEKLFEKSEVRTSIKSVKSYAKKNRMRVGGLILFKKERMNVKDGSTNTAFPLVNTPTQSKEKTSDRDIEMQYKVDGAQTLISVRTEGVVKLYDLVKENASIATTTSKEVAVENDTFAMNTTESEISDEEYDIDRMDGVQEMLKSNEESDKGGINATANVGIPEDVVELQCEVDSANNLISVSSEGKMVKMSACISASTEENDIGITTTRSQEKTKEETTIHDLTPNVSIPTEIPDDIKMQHVFYSKQRVISVSGESEVVKVSAEVTTTRPRTTAKVNPTTTKSVSSQEEADLIEENDFFILTEINTSKNNNGIEATPKPCTKYIITNDAEVCADNFRRIPTRQTEEKKKEAKHTGNDQLIIRPARTLETDEDQPVRNVSSHPETSLADQNDVVYPSIYESENISQESEVDSMDHSMASDHLSVDDFDTLFEQGESMKNEPIKTVNLLESLVIASDPFMIPADSKQEENKYEKVPENSLKANFNRLHEKSISTESKSQTIQKENLIEFSNAKNRIDYSPVKEDSSKSIDMDIIETNVKGPEMNLDSRRLLWKIGDKLDSFSTTDHDDLETNLHNRYRRIEVVSVAPPKRQESKQSDQLLPPHGSAIDPLNANTVHIWNDWQDEDDEPLNLNEIPKEICDRIASGRIIKPKIKNNSKNRKATKSRTSTQRKKNRRD